MNIKDEHELLAKEYAMRLWGIDLNDPVSTSREITALHKKIEELESDEQYVPPTPKKAIKIIAKLKIFTKKQTRLLQALSSFKATDEKVLITKTGTKNIVSLKALVSATRKKIVKHRGDAKEDLLGISALYGDPCNGYILKINSHLL